MIVIEFSMILSLFIILVSPIIMSMEDSLLKRCTTNVVGLSLYMCGVCILVSCGVV